MEESAGRPMIIEAKPEPITVNCAEMDVIFVDFIFRTGLFVKGSSPRWQLMFDFTRRSFP